MTTTELKQLDKQMLGNRLIQSTYQNQTVHDTVDSWNWNMSVFDIHDQIKHWSESDQRNVLRYAYQYFDKDQMIRELHDHLTGESLSA